MAICGRIDERGSAAERKPGSGRPKTGENIGQVEELISNARVKEDGEHFEHFVEVKFHV